MGIVEKCVCGHLLSMFLVCFIHLCVLLYIFHGFVVTGLFSIMIVMVSILVVNGSTALCSFYFSG